MCLSEEAIVCGSQLVPKILGKTLGPARYGPLMQVHAIMGTNGSGKSTLAKCLVGHPDYEVTSGSGASHFALLALRAQQPWCL